MRDDHRTNGHRLRGAESDRRGVDLRLTRAGDATNALQVTVSPTAWRGVFERALKLSDGQIRFLGMASMLVGLALLLFL